jgi:hypothetical protein
MAQGDKEPEVTWRTWASVVSLCEGTMRGRRGRKIQRMKSIKTPLYIWISIMHCTESCWMLGKHGDKERVSNGWELIYKARYIQAWSTKVHPCGLSVYT